MFMQQVRSLYLFLFFLPFHLCFVLHRK
jgi:hypothetical protein